MEIVTFNCPHCGYGMEAPVCMDGETHPCVYCNRPVTLHVVSTKQIATTGLVFGALSVAAALLGFGDD